MAKLRGIRDTPHAIALGIGIGLFFGFTPLFGLKTLLALFVTWVLGGNKVAAVIAVSLHDLLLPVLPIFLRWEYEVGYWTLSRPHVFPPHLQMHHLNLKLWLHWSNFVNLGWPMLVGSILLGLPFAATIYFLTLVGFRFWFRNPRSQKSRSKKI